MSGSGTTLAESACPAFTEIHLPGKQPKGNRFATFPGGIVVWAGSLSTDTDGASTAYHPENIGSSSLCDGLDIYRAGRCVRDDTACRASVRLAQAVRWDPVKSPAFCVYGFAANSARKVGVKPVWGDGLGSGPLPVQKEGDPAPGFFSSVTAYPVSSPDGHGVQYADADRLPFLVMPSSLTGKSGPTGYLNAGAIVRLRDNHNVYALVADENQSPAEISVAAAQLIHDPSLSKPTPVTEAELRGQGTPPYPYTRSATTGRIRVSNSEEGPYLVFALAARLGRATSYDPSKVNDIGARAFSSFGGVESLTACAKQFFGD
ncbi:hypothetical protein [Burkholderia sp. BCC0397]|uniref:hypothetical protein n=1 Tax=Burkholderia sp. BCC0397 TaxID=486876 RepID=UPI001FC8E574|nr:hypothetical protein [Burkholderia sp. BCC0397]